MPTYSPDPLTAWSDGTVTAALMNAQIKAAIEDLRSILSGTSAPVTSFSGTGVGAGSDAPTCYRFGDWVYLEGLVTDSSGPLDNAATFCTLPAGYRPASQKVVMAAGDGTTFGKITIATNGTCALTRMGGTSPNSIRLDGIGFKGA